MSGGRGPDFILIGAQRAGTTWLHRALEAHPSIWVPPIKELHYFDDPANKRYYSHLRERLVRGLAGRRLLSGWDVRYFLGPRNDDWYRSLFEPGHRRGKVTGEATPAYAVLGPEGFERIKAINPEVRLIFIMRDPVERMWSAAVNQTTNKNGTGQIKLKQRPDQQPMRKSSYLNTISSLEKHFKTSNLFYGFFDHIKERPAELLSDVLRFLGVEPGNVERLLPPRALNIAAGSRKPPPDYERSMAAAHLPWLREMCERFPGPPGKWRDRYEALLAKPPADASESGRADRAVAP